MSTSKYASRILVSILALAIVIGVATVTQAKMTIGGVEKVAQMPEGVFIEGPVFDKDGNLWFV